MRYFNKKTACRSGHTHASGKEAKRCDALQERVIAGEIVSLRPEPVFTFHLNGTEIKMRNGQAMRYTGDFTYIEGNQQIVEEVKAKNGHMSRDVPVKLALMKAFYPDIVVRVLK